MNATTAFINDLIKFIESMVSQARVLVSGLKLRWLVVLSLD